MIRLLEDLAVLGISIESSRPEKMSRRSAADVDRAILDLSFIFF